MTPEILCVIEIKIANISGIIVIIFSFILTVVFWLFARGLI